MPLQHTHTEVAPVPLTTLPPNRQAAEAVPAATDVANAVVTAVPTLDMEAPRYDAAAVQRIIALAEQMQTRHREMLSAAEVEALGHEVGVEPEFVRLALAQGEAQPAYSTPIAQARTKRGARTVRPASSRHQRTAVAIPLVFYLLCAPVLQILPGRDVLNAHGRHAPSTTLYNILYLCFLLALPAFLAFCAGLRQTNKRRGAKVGVLYGVASMIACAANLFYQFATPTRQPGYSGLSVLDAAIWIAIGGFLLMGTWLGMGALFGASGAVVRRKVSVLRTRREQRFTTRPRSQPTEPGGDWV